MWKNEVELDRPQMTKWRMRFACCITKATNTLRIGILIAFPWQKMVTRTRLTINPLAPELFFFLILAHPVYKM